MVAQSKNGIIVESIVDKKRMQAYTSSKISALEDIAIYTNSGDKPLTEVLQEIYKITDGKMALDPKKATNQNLKELFEKALPDYDSDRVYVSDMKRVFTWYNLLVSYDLISLDTNTEAEVTEVEEVTEVTEVEESVKSE